MSTYAWTQVTPATTPGVAPVAFFEMMTYDTVRDRMVLLGYDNVTDNEWQTWEYYAGDWHRVMTAASPPFYPAVDGMAGCYDAANNVCVLLMDTVQNPGSIPHVETWTYNGTNWTQLTPATSPTWGLCSAENVVYDATNGEVVLFGQVATVRSTWTWDGTTWLNKTPATQPSYRDNFGFCYDAANTNCVLFGGIPGKTDTWTWDGTTWTEVFPATARAAVAESSMTFDASIGKVVCFSNEGNGTWLWDGTDWEQASLSADFTTSRAWVSCRYDAEVGETMGWGGDDPTYLYETWFFAETGYPPPPANPQYQRIYGWTLNISDDALETVDPLLVSPQGA